MKKVKAPKPKSVVVSTKPLPAMGSQPFLSAKIGGVGNTPTNANKSYGKGRS